MCLRTGWRETMELKLNAINSRYDHIG
jgi:hypothetical protein